MLAASILSPDTSMVASFGMLGVILIIFAETGLLVGFFLPGDTLLFLAGALTATTKHGSPHFNLAVILIGTPIAAVLGAQVGYLIGDRGGERLLRRPRAGVDLTHYVNRAERLLERFGLVRAVLLARFLPIVRTIMNPVAGVVKMPARTFALANIAGGVVWTVGVTMLGWALGASVHIDKYILPIIGGITLLSISSVFAEYLRARRRGAEAPVPLPPAEEIAAGQPSSGANSSSA